jgi:hypothetical protein
LEDAVMLLRNPYTETIHFRVKDRGKKNTHFTNVECKKRVFITKDHNPDNDPTKDNGVTEFCESFLNSPQCFPPCSSKLVEGKVVKDKDINWDNLGEVFGNNIYNKCVKVLNLKSGEHSI